MRLKGFHRGVIIMALAAGALATISGPASAIDFNIPLPIGSDNSIHGQLNTTATAGVGFRTQGQNVDLIGKSDLNPNACGTSPGSAGLIVYQNCQGVFRTQGYTSQRLQQVPGSYSMAHDDGDLNYNKGSFFQAPAKVTPDLTLTWGDFGFFGRLLYFYDAVNNDFNERHPDIITPQNVKSVGRVGSPVPGLSALQIPVAIGGGNIPLLSERLYGVGAYERTKRTDPAVLKQVGTNLQYLDSYIYGKIPIPFTDDKKLTFKLGRQVINWGESTTLVFNSINQANPINGNNFYRVGNQLEEDFIPLNQVFLSFEPFSNATLEGFYQLEWQPLEAPAPGSYFSSNDLGTNGAGHFANLAFGTSADDPSNIGTPLDSPLGLITYTTTYAGRSPDMNPRTSGQYGVKLDYYADELNNGTDLALYFEHYHSRLPYVGFFALKASCARREGNSRGNDANSLGAFLLDCPGIPGLNGLLTSRKDDAVPLNSGKVFLEYPEDIDLLGASFSTTFGSYSVQGEASYRPNLPMQVSIADLEFAAAGPALTRCSDVNLHCTGTAGLNIANQANGGVASDGSSDFVTANGTNPYPDTFNLLGLGAAPGSARSFPNFIIPYRGGVVGENAPTDYTKPLNRQNPGYIQGYERFGLVKLDVGVTKVLGASDNPFGADQIIVLGEVGADIIPNLPDKSVLQIDGPNTPLSATAGADGSGADRSRLACSNIPDCSYGVDGLRFNPHQQPISDFVKSFAWGYRVVVIGSYENVLPNIGIHPTLLFSQDIQGTSPGPAFEFVGGRKEIDSLYEIRYKASLSFNVGYTWYWGGGDQNVLSDRDFAQAFVKYQF
ncbi:DUF1302 domain-containing protein [Nevskia soli]|uniref:DUF1302 domain-containing protein n=1 Tax=Nevskia soli TaxID=418856 RepID=UPI00068CE6DF|nr:DUF1302 family protein [Nevskia soli]